VARLAASFGLLSAWLVLLLLGWSAGGAVYLLLLAALALFPWRALRAGGEERGVAGEAAPPAAAGAAEREPDR
jgi:hypothetical protein